MPVPALDPAGEHIHRIPTPLFQQDLLQHPAINSSSWEWDCVLLGVLDAIKLALFLQLDLLLCRGDHGGGQTIQAQIIVRHNAGDLPDIHTDDNSARE